MLPVGHGTGRAQATVGPVSVRPHVPAVLPAGTLLLRAPLLSVLACDAVSRDVFCHPACHRTQDVCSAAPLASEEAGWEAEVAGHLPCQAGVLLPP